MRKYIDFDGSIFEQDAKQDVIPTLIAKETKDKPVNLEELIAKYPGVDIHAYDTNIFNEETRDLSPITYYYYGSKAVDIVEYEHIKEYDPEDPPKNALIEVTLQTDVYKRVVVVPIKNHNCKFMDLIDNAIDDIAENLDLVEGYIEEDYASIKLYDDGGWPLDIELSAPTHYHLESELKDLVTSLRLVEKKEV
jgi:hypothetical protein